MWYFENRIHNLMIYCVICMHMGWQLQNHYSYHCQWITTKALYFISSACYINSMLIHHVGTLYKLLTSHVHAQSLHSSIILFIHYQIQPTSKNLNLIFIIHIIASSVDLARFGPLWNFKIMKQSAQNYKFLWKHRSVKVYNFNHALCPFLLRRPSIQIIPSQKHKSKVG